MGRGQASARGNAAYTQFGSYLPNVDREDILAASEAQAARRSDYRPPEWHLCRAVLEGAYEPKKLNGVGGDLQKPHHATHQADCHKCQAIAWVEGAPAPFTFERVCEVLGLEFEQVQRQLLRYKTAHRPGKW